MMSWMLLAVGVAAAQAPSATPWRDGLSDDAPVVTRAVVSQAVSPRPGRSLGWTDLRVGTPLFGLDEVPLSWGISAHLGTTLLQSHDGPAFSVRSPEAAVWTMLTRDRDTSYVALGAGFGRPFFGNSTYLRHPSEAGTVLYGTVDGYLDRPRADWQLELSLGVSDNAFIHAIANLATVIEVQPGWAVVAGAQVTGTWGGWYSNVGVRHRFGDGGEVGVSVLYDLLGPTDGVLAPDEAVLFSGDVSWRF